MKKEDILDHTKWWYCNDENIIEEKILSAMDIYAKKQSMAFVNYVIEKVLIATGQNFIADLHESEYDEFVKNQNKQ